MFLSFYGDIVRQPCPLSSPRASPSSEWDGKNGERGQSVMSKKTLEDRRAPPPGLDSTPLIDWFAPTDKLREVCGEGREAKKKGGGGVKQHDRTWDVKSLWNIIRLIPLGHQR